MSRQQVSKRRREVSIQNYKMTKLQTNKFRAYFFLSMILLPAIFIPAAGYDHLAQKPRSVTAVKSSHVNPCARVHERKLCGTGDVSAFLQGRCCKIVDEVIEAAGDSFGDTECFGLKRNFSFTEIFVLKKISGIFKIRGGGFIETKPLPHSEI